MENNKKRKKLSEFFKRYGYYALALALVVGISLAVALSAISMPPVRQEEVPTSSKTLEFSLPVDSPNVTKWFSSTELFFNSTLGQWESHKAIDMVSENLKVYAVLGGVVTSVESSYNDGTKITITHDDGFVSVYSSLDSETTVAESDIVNAGDEIGKMSSSSANELNDGAHLHFELYKDGQKVDPSNYLTLENK